MRQGRRMPGTAVGGVGVIPWARNRILSGSESNKAAREIIRCNYSSAVSACSWGLAAIWLNTPHFEKFVIWQ